VCGTTVVANGDYSQLFEVESFAADIGFVRGNFWSEPRASIIFSPRNNHPPFIPFRHQSLLSFKLHFAMLSRRFLVASRVLRAPYTPQLRYSFPLVAQQLRSYADKIVKVPEMAESISEGTLKQWSKQIGDFVEQDEEIATIETDKVRATFAFAKLS
jgi:hypothetical protein